MVLACWALEPLNPKSKSRPVVLAYRALGPHNPQPKAMPADKRPEFLLRYLGQKDATDTHAKCRPVVLAAALRPKFC